MRFATKFIWRFFLLLKYLKISTWSKFNCLKDSRYGNTIISTKKKNHTELFFNSNVNDRVSTWMNRKFSLSVFNTVYFFLCKDRCFVCVCMFYGIRETEWKTYFGARIIYKNDHQTDSYLKNNFHLSSLFWNTIPLTDKPIHRIPFRTSSKCNSFLLQIILIVIYSF